MNMNSLLLFAFEGGGGSHSFGTPDYDHLSEIQEALAQENEAARAAGQAAYEANQADPLSILSQPIGSAVSTAFVKGLGLPELMHTVRVFGMMSAVIVIVCSLLSLAVVNYPKTLMQTKTRIVSAVMVVIIISLILMFADITLSILYDSFM